MLILRAVVVESCEVHTASERLYSCEKCEILRVSVVR